MTVRPGEQLRQLAARATPPRPIPEWWSDEAVEEIKAARLWLDNRSPDLAVLVADLADYVEADWGGRTCNDPDCPCAAGRATKLLARVRELEARTEGGEG